MTGRLGKDYARLVAGLLDRLPVVNREPLRAAAESIAASLARGEVLHTFGSGHSAIVAQEIVHRAGGLIPVSQIPDPTAGYAENVVGYGSALVERYDRQFGLRAGECLIAISNSGKNCSPIEVALYAKSRRLTVIALTSVAVAERNRSEHPSGLRLHEVAHHVLDNLSLWGDAAIEVPGTEVKAGPTSTLCGALLLNLLNLEVLEHLSALGQDLPLLQSGNTPGGKERNSRLALHYQSRLSRPI